ncbi:MAG TPA: septal ring lytic transglycosylase RlpA family protein [Steroidobacteraceae bacterium]|nr:septal ring lytic transglycosylase RlpA family protein [Steroidobacteraceae bacterium]
MSRRLAAAALAALVLAGCGTPPRPVAAPPPPERVVVAAPRPSDAAILALPDAVPSAEPRAALGNPPFYEVYGQRYTVLESSHDYLERGVASWYGPDFHGVRTSTGEPYDMYAMTAAHRTLPLPAYARVTNLRNGRSVIVRINDRGPFKANRIIDLSYAAALKLDMVRDGTTLVEVRALEPGGVPPPAPPPAQLYAQAGAFAVADNAERLRDRLAAAGVGPLILRSDSQGGRTLYRLRIGPIESVDAYDALVGRLRALGVSSVVLAPN